MYPTLKDTAELSSATAESDANAEGNKIAPTVLILIICSLVFSYLLFIYNVKLSLISLVERHIMILVR